MILLGVAAAAVVAFVLSFAFYSIVPAGPDEPTAAWQIGVEALRNLATAGLVAGLLVAAGWAGVGQGALLGLALAVLPAVLLTGSVVWERVPVRSAAAHTGDWLLKLLAIGAVVGATA